MNQQDIQNLDAWPDFISPYRLQRMDERRPASRISSVDIDERAPRPVNKIADHVLTVQLNGQVKGTERAGRRVVLIAEFQHWKEGHEIPADGELDRGMIYDVAGSLLAGVARQERCFLEQSTQLREGGPASAEIDVF
jgi:hypothetical protein